MLRLDQKYPVGEGYQSEITFIGSLYTEKKHCLYEKFSTVPDYVKGYLDGLIQAQKNVQGYLFMQELLTEEIVKEMQKVYPTNPESECVLSPEAIYADYVLARQVTALERKECLERLGRVARTKLYTHEKTVQIGNVINCGPCDYYNQMPQIIRTSKINLNITLRSIKTGIPLRVLDIMGNGGFLVTNYQEEMMQYFEPDKEFVTELQSYSIYNKYKFALKRCCPGKHYSFHELRHYCASVMIMLGIPVKYIADYLGHETEDMVNRVYGHVMADKKDEMFDRLELYYSKVIPSCPKVAQEHK